MNLFRQVISFPFVFLGIFLLLGGVAIYKGLKIANLYGDMLIETAKTIQEKGL